MAGRELPQSLLSGGKVLSVSLSVSTALPGASAWAVTGDQYGGVYHDVLKKNVFPYLRQAQYGVVLGEVAADGYAVFRFKPAIGGDAGQQPVALV